ncbi:hypothetical protein [Thiomicrorhabdus sp. Milos-T2]|uniref:hypothetical protein n=1 Tax=Thiomicrorhabdus sp. Milos-T2 TaxID=90814 RepID=UPI00131A2102|nr:hypothetical protein [Thiomicrorhabdus sp. Milos-T2]
MSDTYKPEAVNPETLPTPDSNMAQVKNLLFGAEVQELNQKRERLENAFNERLAALEKDFKHQIKALNSDFSQQLTSEKKHSQQDLQVTKQHFQQVEDQLEALTQQQSKNHQQLEDLLHIEISDLNKQMNDQFDQLETLIQQKIDQLHERKVSKEQMADLLMTLAQGIKQSSAE